MKSLFAIVIIVVLNTGALGEELNVTFGAVSDLAVMYGKHDLTVNAKQNGAIAAPQIRVDGLDLDGHGANDDKIEVKFAVTATGDGLARFARGYRLDAGDTLAFEIVAATRVMGTGDASVFEGRFVSAVGNNRAASFTSENKGHILILKSTASGNNRVRDIVGFWGTQTPRTHRCLQSPAVHELAGEQRFRVFVPGSLKKGFAGCHAVA